jgi:hypothetical protein
MFFLNRRMSSAKATRFSSGFISEHEILMLLANKTQKVRGKKMFCVPGPHPQILKKVKVFTDVLLSPDGRSVSKFLSANGKEIETFRGSDKTKVTPHRSR